MVTQQKAVRIHGEPIGRSLRKRYAEASLASWEDTGRVFHGQYRKKRFTKEHAREADYEKRKAKYVREKFRRFGHRDPLVKTGEAKRLSATARVKPRAGTGGKSKGQLNQGGVTITYRALRKLNFRNPHSSIDMADEFRRLTNREVMLLGLVFSTRFTPRFTTGN